ncbi:hypothetical protein JW960_19405 [candidate division KSB1 bacterium]|nr:hypothetical protein [candidate division KSB1 bacterium]
MSKQNKKKKKKRKSLQGNSLLIPKRSKMSELIQEFAGDYIGMGDNLVEKQNLLRSASTAWNIGNLSANKHKDALDEYIEVFKKYNPGTKYANDLRENMEILIRKKVTEFSAYKKQIVNAEIYQENGVERIVVFSTPKK